MTQKVLAVLLVLSWMVFSTVDMLEDLDFELFSVRRPATGLSGIAGAATQIAWILFVIFLILFVVTLIMGRRPPV
jgi:uncharacterized membrane protein YtjA (UPF0391 family)